jgi:hypothetical protein
MPKKDKEKTTAKFKNTIKAYAKKYNISVIDDEKFKSVNRLSNEIYDYEKKNHPHLPMYPFFNIKGINKK